jgi:hypothetical protein
MSVTLEEAKAIALEHARRHLAVDVDLAVVESHVSDLGQAWRIPYNSRVFLETKSVSHALAGNLPVLVDKNSGKPEFEGPRA